MHVVCDVPPSRAGFYVVMNAIGAIGLARVHIERNIGTSRTQEADDEAPAAAGAGPQQGQPQAQLMPPGADGAGAVPPADRSDSDGLGDGLSADEVAVEVGAADVIGRGSGGDGGGGKPGSSASSVLPFSPITLVWKDVTYVVPLPSSLGGGHKQLLQGVSGCALPGRMMALMGASGAGKTTLLDVLAGRKTSGTMHGAVLVNGFPKESKSFARISAYVEQNDVHETFSTVAEALAFSAALRLQPSVSAATRRAFVDDIIRLLELDPIRDREVGAPGSAEGLSPGQRKILTIAVELVSNAPLIFLDEPTSGLDSRAAQVVIREVRKIANLGRTVVCTVHQPSKELFLNFDDVCLLQRGGWQARCAVNPPCCATKAILGHARLLCLT